MTRKKIKIETFTIFQDDGHRQIFLEIGPRYNPPLDDTAVLRVGHKTTDPGGVSVLLEKGDFLMLQACLAEGRLWTLSGTQTMAQLSWADDRLEMAIWWKGSGRLRTFTFDAEQVEAMDQWMSVRILQGWTGWKTGITA